VNEPIGWMVSGDVTQGNTKPINYTAKRVCRLDTMIRHFFSETCYTYLTYVKS